MSAAASELAELVDALLDLGRELAATRAENVALSAEVTRLREELAAARATIPSRCCEVCTWPVRMCTCSFDPPAPSVPSTAIKVDRPITEEAPR